ncbi:peptidase M23 [Micromonospora sp. NPDC048830]|uniref:peptidase M23 n=1 Tax=Micromonospora sp. NPDC048830 TaxID=3364257 RepID=UPI0037124300
MRDDGTLDDQHGPGGTTGRSDVTPSPERPASTTASAPPRRPWSSLAGLSRTRFGSLRNLLLPGRPGSGPARARVALATGVVCCLGLAAFAQARGEAVQPATRAGSTADAAERAGGDAASRSLPRTPVASPSATSSASPSTDPDTTRTPAPRRSPARPADPAPVAGLTRVQMTNAKTIVTTGRKMGVPRRGLVIAVATAMQESNLYNYASGVLPESQNYPHQAIGWDHDSVGLFQQRPSSGWGEVGQLMNPAFATRQFLTALREIPGWEDMALTDAAQAVQVSAYPWAYAQHEWRATEVVDAFLGR